MRFSEHISLPFRFLIGILIVFAISLGIFYLVMRPPAGDLGLMVNFLAITAAISGLAGYAAYRMGWMQRFPTLRLTLMGGYALSTLLTFFNVWMTARLMFASQHDLQLATILLVFAGGIAMLLGYFLSNTVTERIQRLELAARQLAQGNLSVRVPVSGRDEVASLAGTFNQMAEKLQEADQKQKELDALRRELVAWAGHDLQTPLTSIRLAVEALADGVVEDATTQQRYLRTTQREVQRISILIDDMFQIAQLDAGGLRLDITGNCLSDLVSDTLESFSAQAAKQQVTLTGNVQPGVDPVQMDAQRFGRVLNNLVANALRYTPAKGYININAFRESGNVVVEVVDTGQGIEPEDLPHIFERFYRGEKSRSQANGGSGLGLAISKGIIEAHHGAITVTSQPGRGTRFNIFLPG